MRNIPDNMQIWKIIVVFTTMFRKIREKWQQQSRNMCGCGHFLIQQGELSAESARSSWKPMYRWLILTGSCAGLICGL